LAQHLFHSSLLFFTTMASPADSDTSRRSTRGQVRPREMPIKQWMIDLWDALGLNVEEQEKKLHIWKAAKSKTLAFGSVDETSGEDGVKLVQKARTLSSRQYVLHCSRTESIVASYEAEISKIPGLKYDEIGFSKPRSWKNQALLVVDGGKCRKGGKPDPEITSFIIVGLVNTNTNRIFTIVNNKEKEEIFNQIEPFLNIIDNISDPPQIFYRSEKGSSLVIALYDKARKMWEQFFTKNVSVVTKERFQVVTHLKLDTFDKLTRLKHVVEKEDWYKICMFLCPTDPEFIEGNTEELVEAVKLVENKVLHFSLMTMVDGYSLDQSVTGVDIIPAFRLWRYSFYQLFIRDTERRFRRFFLCKHHQGDNFMFQYNPSCDCVSAVPLWSAGDVAKRFFYIVPIEGLPCDRLPAFDSLTQLYEDLCSPPPMEVRP